jgi:hypothetical protein
MSRDTVGRCLGTSFTSPRDRFGASHERIRGAHEKVAQAPSNLVYEIHP